MSVKIVVLDDGETWSGAASVLTITESAWHKLCNGEEVKDLTDEDVLHCQEVDTGD